MSIRYAFVVGIEAKPEKAEEVAELLLASPPKIRPADVLAAK